MSLKRSAFVLSALAAACLAGETLYNGIVLPDAWPPRIDPTNKGPMRIPYLEKANRPAVVPIDLGRQLFVDDFLVEKTEGVSRVYGKPVKYAGNPVLRPETAFEIHRPGNSVALPKGGGMWWDEARHVFRLWYEAGWCHRIAYAESPDGIRWTRPDLGFDKETPNRLLLGQKVDSWSVVYDPDTADSSARWKFQAQPGGNPRPCDIWVSADGFNWTKHQQTGLCGDRTTMFYNPFRRKWVFSIRGAPFWRGGYGGRNRSYWETADFSAAGAAWGWVKEGPDAPNAVYNWLQADEQDIPDPTTGQKRAQLYNFDAVAYESIMLGAFEVHLGPENEECSAHGMPKITDILFAYSRDGFHFDRPDRTAAIRSERWAAGKWDAGYVQPLGNICVIKGDELWFYYGAFGGNPQRLEPDRENNCYYNGMYDHGCMGLAKMRRDGFVGLRAARGTVLTRPVRFSGKYLFANYAAPQGSVRAEALDESGRVLAAFAPATGDRTKGALACVQGDFAACANRPVRFRFTLENATLYAFWVSARATGESGGYLAGGGPGYAGIRDVPRVPCRGPAALAQQGDARTVAQRCRALTDARIAEIRATPNPVPGAGAPVYYVSPAGDDAADGRTPATAWRSVERVSRAKLAPGSFVLFQRGGLWRTSLDRPGYGPNRPFLGYAGGLRAQPGVTYSAYGAGPKPRLVASPFNGADPKRWRATENPCVWACDLGRTDVGNVVFDEGAAWGFKIVPVYHKDGTTTAQYTGHPFKDYRDLDRDLCFYHDWSTNGIGRATGTLYLHSRENPGTRFKSIEFGVRHNIITAHGQPNVTIDNLCLLYCGAHGIHNGGAREFRVQNCEIGWIGGGIQGENLFGRRWPVRYGNAVEVGGCDGCTVTNCYVYQIYDAGLTHQADAVSRFDGKEKVVLQKRIRYVDNVIEKCNYMIEYFISNCPVKNPSRMEDYVIAGNLMWDAGSGLCEQRPDRNQDAHIKSWRHANRASRYAVRDNLFAGAHRQLVEICAGLPNQDGSPSTPRLENNLFLGTSAIRLGAVQQLPQQEAPPTYWPMTPASETPLNAFGGGNRVLVLP